MERPAVYGFLQRNLELSSILERHAENHLPRGVLSSSACGRLLPNAGAALMGAFFFQENSPQTSLSAQNNSAEQHGLYRGSVQAFLRNTKKGLPSASERHTTSPAEELLSGNIEDAFRSRMSLPEWLCSLPQLTTSNFAGRCSTFGSTSILSQVRIRVSA